MEIALELDRKEKELMAEMGTETPEFQKFSRVRCLKALKTESFHVSKFPSGSLSLSLSSY